MSRTCLRPVAPREAPSKTQLLLVFSLSIMLRITKKQCCSFCNTTDMLWFPLLPDIFFPSSLPPYCRGHPSPSYPSSFCLHHPLVAISKEPASSEACGSGQSSLHSGPIYFSLVTATFCCRVWEPGDTAVCWCGAQLLLLYLKGQLLLCRASRCSHPSP